MSTSVAVLGGGVSGLTTALRLLQSGFRVELATPPEITTTSHVAGALWELPPLSTSLSQTDPNRYRSWCVTSWHQFQRMSSMSADNQTDPVVLPLPLPSHVVGMRPGFTYYPPSLAHEAMQSPSDSDLAVLPGFAAGSEAEFREVCQTACQYPLEMPSGYSYFRYHKSPIIRMSTYLAYLTQCCSEWPTFSRRILPAKYSSWQELKETISTQIIVNCTGLGSHNLFDDRAMFPVRGQVLIVKNPLLTPEGPVKLETFLQVEDGADCGDDYTYMFPHSDYMVLGGLCQVDNWSCDPDPKLTPEIIARCARLWPALKCLLKSDSVIPTVSELFEENLIDIRVGLRPGRRGGVRLEVDRTLSTDKQTLIHNYGHSGEGITLSWGCADDVVKLAQDAAKEH